MELSKNFVERLSEIFFYEEKNGEQMEDRLSDILLNNEIGSNIINDKEITRNRV